MPKRKSSYFNPHIDETKAPVCEMEGCVQAGVYKAPKSRNKIDEYQWFCLEHIKERNQQWDYFSGMNSEEIEAFISDAVTGHRPTWSRESRLREHYFTLQDKLYEFISGTKPSAPKPKIASKTRKALAIMEMEYPYTMEQLKARYRVLVKKHHPDTNKGDKESEEKFKKITAAYRYLAERISQIQ